MNSLNRVLAMVGLLLGCSGPAYAAVIFVSTPELRGFSIGFGSWPGLETFTGPSWECDFDGDGTPEVLISSITEGIGYSGVYARPYAGVEVLAAPYAQVYVLSHGISVGLLGGEVLNAHTPNLFDPYYQVRWADQIFRTGKFDMLTAPSDAGQGGTFAIQIRYLGVRFQKSDGWHYGWIGASGDPGGLDIYDYAWETEPDKAIMAGLIPEPGSLLLLGASTTVFAMRRRRKLRV